MKVSVIIPCYNFGEYIEQSILSAVAQRTNFDFEILVRDDFSTDNSQINIERIACLNPIVNFYRPVENLGAFGNIKFLIEQAKGDYIAWLDGDDYWIDLYKLQKQVDFMEENKEYSLTFTGLWDRYTNGDYWPGDGNSWLGLVGFENNEVTTEHLLNANYVTFGKVFRNIDGLIKDWMSDLLYMDWAMNYELSKIGKIKYLDFISGVYRCHSGGVSVISDEDKNLNIEKIKEKLK